MTDDSYWAVPDKDREILRKVAEEFAAVANLPVQKEKAEMWTRFNDLDPVRPMVLIFPEGAWREMGSGNECQCESAFGRHYESYFRTPLYYWEHMQDDNPIEPIVPAAIHIQDTGIGISSDWVSPEQSTGASRFDPVLKTEADIDKIQIPEVTVDWESIEKRYSMLKELFGNILEIERRGYTTGGCAPVDAYTNLRGIEETFMDMIDNPGMIHAGISRLVDGNIARIRQAEELGVLTLGLKNHYAGSGGNCYTSQLPQEDFDGNRVRPMDQWGFATAQYFSEVSPEMHEEFALKHEKRVLEMFGLNCYGCCEPLHLKLDYVKKIPRLRRVSISPWADVKKSAEGLGSDYIYSWKPNPAIVAGEEWRPDVVRKEIREFLETTRGCVVEMILKDTHTCRNDPRRMWEWTKIAREEAEAFA